jgi:hypothetical protein
MISLKKLAAAVAGLSLATLLWWHWSDGNDADATGDQPLARVGGVPGAADSDDSASGAGFRMATPAPFAATAHAPGSDEFVAATLANPAQPPLPSTIPALSDAQVDQLAVAYLQLAKPTEKAAILWALGFSQNDRAFDTLQYALTSEYSGAVLSTADNVAQLQVVPLIGVLARTSDRAWQFLVNLTRPDAWGWIKAWSEDYLTEQYQSEERSIAHVRATLQGKVIHALGASGRPEFMTWANSLYEGGGDPASFNQRHANSVAAAVFQATFIAEHGFDEFYDRVMYDTRQGGSAYSRWIQSSEGQRWTRWWEDQVTQAVNRESAKAE